MVSGLVDHVCMSRLLSHFDKVIGHLEANANVDVIYLDSAKALEKVNHGILLHKLKSLGKWQDWNMDAFISDKSCTDGSSKWGHLLNVQGADWSTARICAGPSTLCSSLRRY